MMRLVGPWLLVREENSNYPLLLAKSKTHREHGYEGFGVVEQVGTGIYRGKKWSKLPISPGMRVAFHSYLREAIPTLSMFQNGVFLLHADDVVAELSPGEQVL